MSASFRFCPQCGQGVVLKVVKEGESERHFCESCGRIHFLSPKLAAGIIVLHEGKMVLARRDIEPGWGLWTYPGGFVELGETVEQAAIREAKEEIKAEVELEGLLGVYSYPGVRVAVVMYRGRSVGEKPRSGDEVQEVQFFSPDEIPWEELAFASVTDALKDYLKCR